MQLTAIPTDFGSGGSGLVPNGSSKPTLRTLLEEHRAALAAGQESPVDLTDASVTVQVGGGRFRRMPAATLSANRTITLGTTGAVAGDIMNFIRLDVGAFTLAFVNGGAGAGTLLTLPVSKLGSAQFLFDGTNWHLRAFGMQP